MTQIDPARTTGIRRRTLTTSMAWAVPAIPVAAAAPAYASSGDTPPPVIPNQAVAVANKCSGQSTGSSWGYVFTFAFTTAPASATADSLIVNGQTFGVACSRLEGTTFIVTTVPSGNSANASGSGVITYAADGGPAQTAAFSYTGTKPAAKELCECA